MYERTSVRPLWAFGLLIASIVFATACSRTRYRVAADREAYSAIAERNGDPRWSARDFGIDIDPRSRYFDVYNPDQSPMPQDDPSSHLYMHCVDGKKGWKFWHENGVRSKLENPDWHQRLSEYVEINQNGAIELDVDSALKLAYVHAPNHQFQLETLYLSALDVTTERFRLDAQFFGGYDVAYRHDGGMVPAALVFDPGSNQFVITQPFNGVERNQLTVGSPASADPALQVSRRFANAGQLLAGFANSFVFEFAGPNQGLSASLLNFTFLQPLLRGAGRDIALEQLTFAERSLLANLRAYAQFRQGFYTQVAIGEQGVAGTQRGARSTAVQVFSGLGGVDGYVGLLQQLQQIRNSQDNLSLQVRTLEQLEFRLAAGEIDLVQVDQFRQNVESERASLLVSQNNFERSLDTYKTSTLGLPPDLLVDLDDSLIRQFQLVDRDATMVQDAISRLQDRKGQLPEDGDPEELAQIQQAAYELMSPLRELMNRANADFDTMLGTVPARKERMDVTAIQKFDADIQQLSETVADLELQYAALKKAIEIIENPHLGVIVEANETTDEELPKEGATEDFEHATAPSEDTPSEATVNLLREMLRLAQSAILVQARARLETVMVDEIDLPYETAFQIALVNRLDFMNGRAALVDSWRLIQVNADALQSVLNLTSSGDIRTARNNPLSFRSPTTSLQMGVQFDAPFTRLVERNNYREALITYQRNRRAFIQSRDSLHLDLRVLLRQIEQLRTNLEIQRRAVAIAIRRVDLTREVLNAPVRPPQPGQQTAQFGPTAAINLLSAQSALRDTQNAFLGAWLSYYAAKMRLSRELGIMQLDQDGRWIETPLPILVEDATTNGVSIPPASTEELPPAVPEELLDVVNSLPEGFTFEATNPTPGIFETEDPMLPRVPEAPFVTRKLPLNLK